MKKKRSVMERVRLEHSLGQLEATAKTIRETLELAGNGAQTAEALLNMARVAAFQLVRLEAFEQAERKADADET